MYDPTAWITDPALKAHVANMPRPQQQAIAEAMNCVLTCHGFYAAPEAAERIASPNDFDMVPFFHYFDPGNLPQHFRDAAGRECGLSYRQSTIEFEVGKYSADLVAGIDGARSIGELIETVHRKFGDVVTQSELWQHFMAFYKPLNTLDILLLRHRSTAPIRGYPLEVIT